MPSVPDEYIPFTLNRPRPAEPEPDEGPGLGETLGAGGTVANWVYRSWRHVDNRAQLTDDPDHDPFAMIEGTPYAADPSRFASSGSAEETQAIMREMDQDREARETLARAGWGGTVAAVGMGMLDPTVFLPIVPVVSGVARGANAVRIGADVALSAGAGAAVAEGAMLATTPDMTVGDAAVGVGAATLLGGFLGAGAGALLSRAERQGLEAALAADRAAIAADAAGDAAPDPAGAPAGAPAGTAAASAGAAAADTRELRMRSVPGLSRLPDPTGRISPSRRLMNSTFLSVRRAAADLIETPYIFEENLKGVATTQGPALDRLAKLEVGRARVGLAQEFERLYTDMRASQGKATGTAAMFVDRLRGRDYSSFKEMVDEALRNGDKHDVPQVAEAARYFRETIIRPWTERAQELGMLPDELDPGTAESYMMRVWNKEKLVGERPAAVRVFADWLRGEEGKKVALQDSLRDLKASVDSYDEKISKLEDKLARRMAKLEDLEARSEELTRLNRMAFQRATQLRGRGDPTRPRLDNARGGAVFETGIRGRGNRLADRRTGTMGELDALQIRLTKLEQERLGLRKQIERAVDQWEGKSARRAQSALARRAASEVEGSTAGTSEVDAAVRRILATERVTDPQELEDLANEIVDRITGSPDGRMPYDAHRGGPDLQGGARDQARGPLAPRVFMIPDNLVLDFIDRDAQNTAEIFLNTMVPDVLLTERFGDVDMTEAFRRIQDEAARAELAAKTPAERSRIHRQRDADIADLAAVRDRIRHTYGFSSDPRQRFMGRMAATAARYDTVTNLGGVVLSSLPDLAGSQWRYGLTSTFRNAWQPFFRAMSDPETRKGVMRYRKQLQTLGIAAESYLNSRTSSLYDVVDIYRPVSRFERGVKWGSDKFGTLNGLNLWTDFGKFAAGMVSGAEISAAVRAVAKGTPKARQVRNLAEGGIDAAMAARIARQLDAPGGVDVVGGIEIPNTGAWADRGAREAFEGALARDVDMMILTPGAEKPLMMSRPIASLILQYKSFVVAATERLLVRSLQARDIQALQGIVSAIGLGILAEYAYSAIVGRDAPKNPADLIKAGVSRSGMLGWYQEANAISSKFSGGSADIFRLIGTERPDSRYISRSVLGAFLGPTANKFENIVRTAGSAAQLEWKAGDTRRLRRLIAGQNLFYIRGLLDKLETGVNAAAGVTPFED